MGANKSQFFGGTSTNSSQTPLQVNTKVLNSQRLVINAVRKKPSFAGMSNIVTPQGVDEASKVATAQNSHRILAKNGITSQNSTTKQTS